MLDTHIAKPHEATESYESGGKVWKYKRYAEGGHQDVFSGAYDHAKWIELSTIEQVLRECGFANQKLIEERAERNGPRILIIATK